MSSRLCTLHSNRLLKKLVAYGIRDYKCERCGLAEWNGQKISLEIHHINGNRRDNTPDNIEILCPNCHSQTDNFRFRNKTHRQ